MSTMTTFHMRYKGEEDIKRDGANDKQAGSSGGEQSLQRRGNAGEKAVQGGCVGGCVCTYTYLPVKMLNRLYDCIPIIVIYKGQKNESNEIYCFVP